VYWPFWHTGNSLETLALAYALTGDPRVPPVLANSFALVRSDYHTPYAGNDDIQWHAHAWLRSYEATGNETYLREAVAIYTFLLGPVWQGWNATCGGCNWAENAHYVNTITTSLFASGTAALARAPTAAPVIANRTLPSWSSAAWSWGLLPGLRLPGGGPFLDGVDTHNCSLPVGAAWTYNSAAWLTAGTGLSNLTGDAAFSRAAAALLRGAAAFFGGPTQERACGAGGWCSTPDGRMFKGVLARHVAWALRDWGPTGAGAFAGAWARENAAALLANGTLWGNQSLPLFGQLWQGPFRRDNTPWVAHSAGLDLLLAARAAEVWGGRV
jgi:predicted alpha-1,6-mannanase (GH76 family)